MKQLIEMGFSDVQKNADALLRYDGDVAHAVDFLSRSG